MRIKWISFFTPRYAEQAARLIESMDKFGLDFDVEKVDEFDAEGQDKYLSAVRFKPRFMMEKFRQYADYDAIVWTDADSEIRKPPKLFGMIDADVAVRFRESFELVASTMWWRCCYKVHQFLPKWVEVVESEAAEGLPCPEQQIMDRMLHQTNLDVYRLPEEYVYFADKDTKGDMRERNNLGRVVEPVIYHYQASRTMRTA